MFSHAVSLPTCLYDLWRVLRTCGREEVKKQRRAPPGHKRCWIFGGCRSTPPSSHFLNTVDLVQRFVEVGAMVFEERPAFRGRGHALVASFLGKFPGRKGRECRLRKEFRAESRGCDDSASAFELLSAGFLARRHSKVIPVNSTGITTTTSMRRKYPPLFW